MLCNSYILWKISKISKRNKKSKSLSVVNPISSKNFQKTPVPIPCP